MMDDAIFRIILLYYADKQQKQKVLNEKNFAAASVVFVFILMQMTSFTQEWNVLSPVRTRERRETKSSRRRVSYLVP